MAFTYDVNQLSTSALFQVRLRLGDIEARSHELEDEEITFRLTEKSDDVLQAAYACACDVLARLSRHTDESGAGIQVTRSQRFQQWKDTKRDLWRQIARGAPPSFVGGSQAALDEAAADADYRQPAITRTGGPWAQS